MSVASRRLGPLRILVTVENVEAVFSGRGANPNRDHQNTRQRMWAASAKLRWRAAKRLPDVLEVPMTFLQSGLERRLAIPL
jgi:hypothetical protein